MEIYTSSSGFKHAMGYCPHSVIIAHHRSPPTRPPPQPSMSYQLVPVVPVMPVSSYVPAQQQSPVFYDSFVAEQNRPASRGSAAKIPMYNSLDDPHMQGFYVRKFGQRPKSLMKRNRQEALYRITIKTANVKDAGTTARVFLSIFGSKGKICRKLLTRETMLRGQTQLSLSLNGLDKTRNNDDLYNLEFKRGATDVVYIRCRDLGIIRHIVLEHSGVLLEQSWLCECLMITNVRTGRSWFFMCNKWLSLFPPGDGSLAIELVPGDRPQNFGIKPPPVPEFTDYEIIIVTGNHRSAGTDSQVYITLFGHEGNKTRKIHLKNTSNKNPFERGQTDVCRVKAEYIGELTKVRIEHDNTGRAPGWFLDRIVITDQYDPETKYFASCNKWLATDEGDGQISRDLVLYKNNARGSRRTNRYKVTVFTGTKRGAGTDADVFITLYGSLGDTGAIQLDDKKNNFEAGSKDEFTIECPSVGELNKILIAHNNKGAAPGWFLDRIIIEDLDESRMYEFTCNKWLATDEGDGQISRFLFPKTLGAPEKRPTAGVPYILHIYTGDKANAGTDARVYVVMHHKKETSGQIFLGDGKFERKRMDTFTIDAPEGLSPLTALDIGHDNSGVGPGWFLDKVVVECPSTGIKQTFPCNAWLAEDEGDHRIERRLKENESLRETRAPTIPWYIWVYTSDLPGAGTDAHVILVLYGNKGKSEDIKLKSKTDVFEAGHCDEFKIDAADVGTPYKLRIGHDNKHLFASWHLDRIEMENMLTNKRYVFHCGRWLSKKEDDKQVIRELPAEGPDISRPLPVVKYLVDVYTGNQMGAGTDANVFINIFGERGDTGERPLEYSTKNMNKFERKQLDSFVIEAVSLKQIRKIRIGHDGSGPGAGWFLDKVVVRPEDGKSEPATFICNRWLDTKEDDGKIVRELTLGSSTIHLDKVTYHVNIKTGDRLQAGTDADVYLRIFGDKGDSDQIMLRNSDNTKNKFERGRTDKFTLEFDDLGKIEHIIIGHNGKNPGAGWFLDWIEIDAPMRGEQYRFVCHRWLDKNEEDRKIELDLIPTEVLKKTSVIPYEVTVFTGDKLNAGTDAKVFIQIYGLNGKTEEMVLKSKSDTFERKAVDKFKLEAPDVGQIQKIRIGHHSEKLGSGWYLEKVLIQRHLAEVSVKRKKGFKSGSQMRLSQISATDPNVEEYWFVSRQWFDSGQGDKQTIRELLPTDEAGNKLSDREEVPYIVHVFTGNVSGAGTDANVFLTIYGAHEDSGERELERSKTHKNKFERNQEDVFEVKAISLGELKRIRIRHDNSGAGAAWFLDRVEIEDSSTGNRYHFVCQKWLAEHEGDGKIAREIPALENKALRLAAARESGGRSPDISLEMKQLATTYRVNVITGNEFGSGTNANVYIIIFGEHNDTGIVPLTTSKTHHDPFEQGHTDVFEIEAMDIGEPKKIKIGHDNARLRPDWLLERVELDVPKLGRTWKFPCGKWLSKSKGDCVLEVELYPKAMATEVYNPFVPYEIKVFTSKRSGAGTNANVFIEIYGVEKTTGELMLCSKTDRKGKFETGSVDTFVFELEDVGDRIEKIRIGHDNHGLGAAWHLDHVEIRRLLKETKTKTFIFPCNRWLAKDEDDRQIVRELVPEKVIEEKIDRSGKLQVKEREVKDRLEMKQYEVDVYTGDKFGCGTNADVFCTIFGDKGDTGERKLSHSETHMDKFERKQMDKFKIECADLGTIYKLKIRHDNSGLLPDWLLAKVEVKDDIRTYTFYCEQWLAKGKGDGKIERTLYEKDYQGSMTSLGTPPRSVAGSRLSMASNDADGKNEPFRRTQRKNIMSSIAEESKDSTEEGIPYTVKVKTGEANDAGTSANVFIRLIGRKGRQTRMIPLELKQKQKFEPGRVDTFSLQEPDIGDLEIVEIEHDGETLADSWFLDDVTIEMPTKGRAYFFVCNEWLSKHKGDGRTKRILRVQDSNQSEFRPLIPYEVTIYTGDVENAGCDCDVSLKLFGTTGSSSEHVIKKEERNFERAAIDNFQCELDDVGKPVKLRVTIVPKSKKGRHRWYLEKIELAQHTQQLQRQKTHFFGLNDWISSETHMFRDIPLTKGGRSMLEQTTYRVTTKTSDISGAGSDANVFIVISGQNGDSGELELKHSSTHMNKFERNNADIFEFKDLLSLGELTKVRIWHDNSSALKSSWHLEYVQVEDTQTGQTFMFPCNKWLSSTKEDRQLVRDLVCSNEPSSGPRRGSLTPSGKVPYEIEIVTSDKQNAGTTQHGWIVLEGKKKLSEKFYMRNTPRKKILRNGQTDTFTFESRPLGDLRRIVLGHEERPEYPLQTHEGREAMWHVAHVSVTDASTGTRYEFPVRKWIEINNNGDPFDCEEKKEDAVSQQRHLRTINYKILVYTGDVSGAGTNAHVSIILYGTLGDTGKRPLKQSRRNPFERGQLDEFTIECLELGELTKLHIEHDNAGFGPDWFLDKVEVINMDTQETIAFQCHRWLSKSHDDHQIQRDLLPTRVS